MSTLCILSYFIFKGTQCGGDLITILHMSKQKYKEVTEFVGSHRTVRLKKKTRKDCTEVCLIPKFTGLTVRLFCFLPCWWEEVGFCRRERTVFCSIMFIHILSVPEGFQGLSKETRTKSLLPACGSSPLKFRVFSYKYKNSQQPPGMGGAAGLTLVIQYWGSCSF